MASPSILICSLG